MPLCFDAFEELKDAYPNTEELTIEEGLLAARTMLSRVQQRALSQAPSHILRQVGGMLFSHAQKGLDKSMLLGEAKVWEEKKEKGKKTPIGLMYILAMVLCAIVIMQLKAQNEPLLMWMVVAALLLVAIGLFLSLKPSEKGQYKITQAIDREALLKYMGEQMRMIDRDMEALESLLPDDKGSEVNDGALDALMKIYEIEVSNNMQKPEIMQAIRHYLTLNGMTQVEYTEHNAPLFQTLPTVAKTRTLVPALLKGEHLVRAGLAIIQKEVAQ